MCTLLERIDKVNSDYSTIFELIEMGEYEEAYKRLSETVTTLIIINNGVANYAMDISKEGLNLGRHYITAPDIFQYLKGQRDLQLVKREDKIKYSNNCFLTDIMLFFEFGTIKHKMDILKLILALVCIYKSYEYEEHIREYAKIFIEILQEIMFCSEIHRIYIQMKDYNAEIPSEERGSGDATTRFSIIFSAKNSDIYVLRIDLPHKGEGLLHLNMEECVGERILPTGYPLLGTADNFCTIRKLTGDRFDDLFFEMNGNIWFKTEFEKKLKALDIGKNEKEELSQIFYKQSHYEINIDGLKNEGCIDFTNEGCIDFTNVLKEYLLCFGLEGSIITSFARNLSIDAEIWRIRVWLELGDKISDGIIKTKNMCVNGNQFLWTIFDKIGLIHKCDEETFMKFTLAECWEYIRGYL